MMEPSYRPGVLAAAAGPEMASPVGLLSAVDRQWNIGWPWSWWASVAFAVIAVAAVAYAYRRDRALGGVRRWSLAGLRTTSFAVLALMLSGIAIARFESVLPDLIVLLDHSQSMTAPADPSREERSRIDAARDLLADPALLQRLQERYDLRVYLVGESAQRIGQQRPVGELLEQVTAEAETSRLGEALWHVASLHRGRSVAALVIVSDGIVTDGRSLQEVADSDPGAPVFAVAVGSDWQQADVAVSDAIADSPALVGDRVEVRARIATAGLADRTIPIQLRSVDDRRVLAESTVEGSGPADRHEIAMEFTVDQPGSHRLEVVAAPQSEETDTANNRAEVTVIARDEAIDVLLVQQQPSFEFRFLKHLLERTAGQGRAGESLVRLTAVLQEGDPRYADQDRTAARLPPISQAELEELDVVILSDADPKALGPVFLEHLSEAVTRQGTGLVVIAGPRHLPQALAGTALEPLLPIDPEQVQPAGALDGPPFRPQLTPFGLADRSLRLGAGGWDAVPPMQWLLPAPRVALGSRVLLQADRRLDAEGHPLPVVVARPVGAGMAWIQLTDESFRMAAGGNADYQRYWLQTIRWLARAKLLAEQEEVTLRLPADPVRVGQPIPIEVHSGAASALGEGGGGEVIVSVSAEGQPLERSVNLAPAPLAPGVFRGELEGLPTGRYRAVLSHPLGVDDPPAGYFRVVAPPSELDHLATDRAALEYLATQSGGRLLSVEQAQRELLRSLPRKEPLRLYPLPERPLWNHPLLAGLLIALLSLEWGLRRRWGLP